MPELQREIAAMLWSTLGGVGVAVFLLLVVMGYLMPFCVWSATRNIKQIRLQLERLNDAIESRAPTARL